MRLNCDIYIASRPKNSSAPRNLGKPVRASLAVGRKPGRQEDDKSNVFLLVCTAKEKSGTKYKMHGNIMQVFNKFTKEGKATIRLHEPPHDLFISKADPASLKSLLSLLKLSAKEINKAALSTLAPAKLIDLERPKKELIVNKRADYPLIKPFPDKIQKLSISNCNMKKFDKRIVLLQELTSLTLTDNMFREIPLGLAMMAQLSELCLADNNIKEFDWRLTSGALAKSLKFLDLRNNNLEYLPSTFCNLKNLIRIKLDGNNLQLLPQRIGSLGKLRHLSASGNKLKILPISFDKLRLESLDLSGNSFLEEKEQTMISCLVVPSLLEAAGKIARKYKCQYNSRVVPSNLCHYLDSAKQCCCGEYCFTSCIHHVIMINIQRISQFTVVSTGPRETLFPAESFLCSQKCWHLLQKPSRQLLNV